MKISDDDLLRFANNDIAILRLLDGEDLYKPDGYWGTLTTFNAVRTRIAELEAGLHNEQQLKSDLLTCIDAQKAELSKRVPFTVLQSACSFRRCEILESLCKHVNTKDGRCIFHSTCPLIPKETPDE